MVWWIIATVVALIVGIGIGIWLGLRYVMKHPMDYVDFSGMYQMMGSMTGQTQSLQAKRRMTNQLKNSFNKDSKKNKQSGQSKFF